MNVRDIAARAAKTFVQSFVATFSVAWFTDAGVDSKALAAVAIASLAAAVSAAWNAVQSEVAARR